MQERLDALRGNARDSDLAVYTDIASGLVLSWSGDVPCPREVLDALAARAQQAFASADAVSEAPASSVIRFSAHRTEVFFRDPGSGDEALCLAAPAGADISGMASLLSETTDPGGMQ